MKIHFELKFWPIIFFCIFLIFCLSHAHSILKQTKKKKKIPKKLLLFPSPHMHIIMSLLRYLLKPNGNKKPKRLKTINAIDAHWNAKEKVSIKSAEKKVRCTSCTRQKNLIDANNLTERHIINISPYTNTICNN